MNGTSSNPPPLTPPKQSGLAVTSLVLGALSVVMLCFEPFLAIPAIICGHVALGRINRSGGALTGKGLAIAGFGVGCFSLLIIPPLLIAIAIPNYVKARKTTNLNSCMNRLRPIDAAKQQWAAEKEKRGTDVPTWADLKPYLEAGQTNVVAESPIPHCPAGGTYTINAVRE